MPVNPDLGPCDLWTGDLNTKGYGVVRTWDPETKTSRRRMAHIVAWEAENGPVPDGHELDHLCRVVACVRPTHLEPVTHPENVTRAWKHDARYRPDACPQNHPYTPENTYTYQRPGRATPSRQCRTCDRAKDARRRARKAA